MEPPSCPQATVLNSSGHTPIPRRKIQVAISRALEGRTGEVQVLLTDDEAIRDLNSRFRGIDAATDVLTFPAPDMLQGVTLGEIAISVETARLQASLRGSSLSDELVTLALHGALHLAGFDDEAPADRIVMLARQNELAAQLGLPVDPQWSSLYQESAR